MRKFLLSGGLVGIPTETVYGLAANALDPEASAKIFEVKRRPPNDPLICHVASFDSLDRISYPTKLSERLASQFWPGPLTMVLSKKPIVPDLVTAGLNSVAVRCSSHPVMKSLTAGCDFPIAAPSANPFAYISPTRAGHVQASLGNDIEFILDGGPCKLGLESTIIDARDEASPRVLRHGALCVEEIEKTLGITISSPETEPSEKESLVAPGALPKHYSPRCPLEVRASGISENEIGKVDESTAFLFLQRPKFAAKSNVYWLSEAGSLSEIAANLYGLLREIDSKSYQLIITEEAKELGLGVAVNDRLRRASKEFM